MSQELVPSPAPDPNSSPLSPNSLAALGNVLAVESTPFYCSFDLATPEGRKMLFRMDSEADFQVKQSVKQQFRLQHVYAAPADKKGPAPGEVIRLTRIVLVSDKGETYECFSKGIRETISKLAFGYGMPPWNPPLLVEVYAIKLQLGELLKLRVLEEPAAPKGGKR